jgi:hypothetical protein
MPPETDFDVTVKWGKKREIFPAKLPAGHFFLIMASITLYRTPQVSNIEPFSTFLGSANFPVFTPPA